MKSIVLKKGTFSLVLFLCILLAACSRAVEATPQATQKPPPSPVEITYCDIDRADLCLEGFGLGAKERLLIQFKTDDPLYADVYIRAVGSESEILFECKQSEIFPVDVYCLGEPYQEGQRIKLNIYSKSSDKLIAIGVFDVTYITLPEPDVIFGVDATETPSPEPSYSNPSYPNPSYPNPTFAP